MNAPNVRALIGDIELFRPVLDGFFRGWEGAYDIMIYDTGDYLFYPSKAFSPLCKALRSQKAGEELCHNCDLLHARESAGSARPVHYLCHAGLKDIAAPIVVNGCCLATVFCGQRQPWLREERDEAKRRVAELGRHLGINAAQLWGHTKRISKEELTDVEDRLTNLTLHLSDQFRTKIDLIDAQQRLQAQVRESEAVHIAFRMLNEVPPTEEEFWERLTMILNSICSDFEVSCGAILTLRAQGDQAPTVRAVANLPHAILGKSYAGDGKRCRDVLEGLQATVVDLAPLEHDSLAAAAVGHLGEAGKPNKAALLPLDLDRDNRGVMMLFARDRLDRANSLPIEEELTILERFTAQISATYKSVQVLRTERHLAELRTRWLQDVVHEISQPLNGILGYAETWYDTLKPVTEDRFPMSDLATASELENLRNQLESIIWMSINASQVASNFAWIAGEQNSASQMSLEVDSDVAGTLIACARDKQGQGRKRNIAVHVNAPTVRPLNGRVRIERRLFKQSVRNLLDNAVKYADEGTRVNVSGEVRNGEAVIRISNIGMPVLPGEEEQIFERHMRSQMAKDMGVPGTGIGLSISREIMRLHDGDVRTTPSTPSVGTPGNSFETIFEITLPLLTR